METVVEEARKMDSIDYELQKKVLCTRIQDALNVDFLIGETNRQKEDRQFIAAMYLLFPGSIELYNIIINE